MKATKTIITLVLGIFFLLAQSASAVPIFQVYIDGATPGTIGPDEDTWFTNSNPLDLIVSGAYGPKIDDLSSVTLLISVPQGETGTISITGGDGAVLLTERTDAADGFYNPNTDAVLDLLTNEAGNADGFDGYADKDFLPEDVEFNNHYPFQEGISDFLIYALGDFDKIADAVSNYSTEDGISYNVADGEEKLYSVLISGFSAAHFDVYGYAEADGCKSFQSTWSMNPASHDATYMVPEPATVFLLGLGWGMLRRAGRKTHGLNRG
ncbi:MAG: choice-of-anchor N protein [Sedimentisphaerales bacterium]|nr:choice-of-anchor N protein [Sedimentisphaerales bacterium]